MPLTVAFLDAKLNKTHKTIIRKSDSNGLGVRITKTGKVVFTFRYRYQNKQTSIDLGEYPELSLANARNVAEEYRVVLKRGEDPADIKKKKNTQLVTFRDFAQKFVDEYLAGDEVRHRTAKNYFFNHLDPLFGDLVPAQCTTMDFMALLQDLKREKSNAIFINCLTYAKQMLGYATKFYGLSHSAMATIGLGDFKVEPLVRSRFHSDQELGWLMNLADDCRLVTSRRNFFLMVIHWGCRVGELCAARMEDFDLHKMEWVIPKSKNQKPIIRPIPDVLKPLIELQRQISPSKTYLFGTKEDNPAPPCHGSRVALRMQELATDFEVSMSHWVMHDMRRNLRSNVNRWVSDKVGELMLGHTVQGVDAIYNKWEYLDEMREGYAQWANFLQQQKQKYPLKRKGA